MIGRWVRITLIWLVITAILGTLLRFYPFYPLKEITYPHLLHGHSHVAFLGWIFNAFFILLTVHYLLNDNNQVFYNRLFIGMQVMVVGMLVLFPLYGYNPLTIGISTVHTVLTIVFAVKFFRHGQKPLYETSVLALNIALFFMLLSTIGPFFLGPLSISGMKETIWYNLAIYFYLHFQYNGWFFFGMIGMSFFLLETHRYDFNRKDAFRFIWLNAVAVVPAFALSVLWTDPPMLVYGLALLGTGIQLFSLVFLFRILGPVFTNFSDLFPARNIKLLLSLAFLSFAGRNLLQFAGCFPGLAEMVSQNRFVIIAFLHLIFLGMLTPFLMAVFMHSGWVQALRRSTGTGILLFILSFVISEIILFMSPIALSPLTPQLLLALAIISAIGLFTWTWGRQKLP